MSRVLIPLVSSVAIFAFSLQLSEKESPDSHNRNKELLDLAKEYRQLKPEEWKKKRDFCIRLIDDKIIGDGTTVSDISKVFGDDATIIEGRKDVPAGGIVQFERIKGDGYSAPPVGWHMQFTITANGYIKRYYLSNVGK